MAIYRQIYISFWTDSKIDEDFTPEDKYFYFYCLTNPHTNICGCYEIGLKQMARETGYNIDTVTRLIKRMQEVHKVVEYDFNTKELLIYNWHKYNWTKSPKLMKNVEKCCVHIKSEKFKQYLDTVLIGYKYPIDTSVTDTVTDTVTDRLLINNNIYNAHFSNEQEKELCQKEDGNTESESLASETVAGLSDELNRSMTVQDIPGKAESLAVKKAAGVSERLNRSMTLKNSRFDEFWKIYPRRAAKKEAQKAWKKIEPEKIPLILEAVERQKKSGALSREPQYIPHPATWLNRGQWEDEETAPKQKARKEFIITGHDELGNATGYWEETTC